MVDAGMIPTVLVTDDDADFRGVVCEALARRGVHTAQAADGDEALRVIEKTAIHMVLLDVHMPRVTGLDVMRILSQRPNSMPYVLMSALMDEAIEREAARMRAYKILRKPVRLGQLREIVCGGLTETYGWRPPE
ncbi:MULTISPECIES: response regulator [Rhodopirellula]|uniref:Transcriptional control n=1 Tax=Rhodopirellula islandica TaxID=595434 RepID=A0A0J1B2W6_RHOIS|nr:MULTISPECIES: response regulator [Rhodopirellula]KLU01122.1 transcriptional control [Rhodopirellula islandica]WDQ15963.1 response regulator [Rhodopirellula sp. P2]